jgi:DNA transformation protein
MAKRVGLMRNLGPVTQRRLAEVGIHDEEDLCRVGAVEAFVRMRFLAPRGVSRNALYAMHAAIRGCDWRDLDPAEKQRLDAAVPALPPVLPVPPGRRSTGS